jgi:hypothetical protein
MLEKLTQLFSTLLLLAAEEAVMLVVVPQVLVVAVLAGCLSQRHMLLGLPEIM